MEIALKQIRKKFKQKIQQEVRRVKKFKLFLFVAAFLMFPLSASADYLGQATFDFEASDPQGGGYYLDYDGRITAPIATGWFEVFCVSSQTLNDGKFNLYSISSDGLPADVIFTNLTMAAWIADNWKLWGNTDTVKGEAQKAVWKIMGVMDITGGTGTDFDIYTIASGHAGYSTGNWMIAYTPITVGAANYQDFLVPTPIPAAFWLLGSGLMGLVAVRRRRK